jgi:hypothetical protein
MRSEASPAAGGGRGDGGAAVDPALPLLRPQWAAAGGVGAAMSLRAGGISTGPYASANLGLAVGDDAVAVQANRRRFVAAIGARPVWLQQVHGARVVQVGAVDLDRPPPAADAAWTAEAGIACTVQVADCLPVLFAAPGGRAVAAAHAGWRGLAGGVLEAALGALCAGAGCAPGEVAAWLGPCIGPRRFEVGADVLAAFGVAPEAAGGSAFSPRVGADGSPRWLADLPRLARERLTRAGVARVDGGVWCTVDDGARFYSFRRDRVTGRHAAAVWIGG